MADKPAKRATGLGTSAFFQNVPRASQAVASPVVASPPAPAEESAIEELHMPPPVPDSTASPRKPATPAKPKSARIVKETPTEGQIRRSKVTFGVLATTVTQLEDLKIFYRRTYRSRTTYGELIDEAIALLAKERGLKLK